MKKIDRNKKVNPRVEEYSFLKIFFRNIAYFIRYFVYYLIAILSVFKLNFNSRKIIHFKNYHDTRFINFFFHSIKNNWKFAVNLNLNTSKLVKKIGIYNFLKYFKADLFNESKNYIEVVYDQDENQISKNQINFLTNYFKYISQNQAVENKNRIYMPYYSYPKSTNNKISINKNVNFKILFSGSTNSLWYDKFSWEHKSGNKMLSRNEIINFVIKNFNNKIIFLSKFDDIKYIDENKNIALFINDKLVSKNRGLLSNFEHLSLVSSSNFFLTAPGTEMPICHHLIESLKYETIPITSYGDLIYPSLNNTNSLYFESYDELYNSIIKALNMKDKELIELRNNVKNYYINYASAESFSNKFNNLSSPFSIIANNDHDSVDLFKKNKIID